MIVFRELGLSLGLSKELVYRQPFPGPGLAVRILCAKQPFKDENFERTNVILKKILSPETLTTSEMEIIFGDEILKTITLLKHLDLSGLSATLLPVQTVGVQGDSRTYQYIAAISGKKVYYRIF